jgi:syntaxin-binding protein 1
LIVDRTLDLISPLLHEFSVQAMANDLVGMGPDGTRYEYSFSTSAGPQRKTVSLDERDALWTSLRHAHIADCSSLIIERFNKFLTENKAAVKSKKAATGNEDVTSLAELKDTMAALGEFHEMKAEFSLHLSLAQDCLGASDRKKLIEVATTEQEMATGVKVDGEPAKDLWNELAHLLDRPVLTSLDRARLLGIYMLTHPANISDADRRALFDHARLDAGEVAALKQLLLLAGNTRHRQRPSSRPKGSRRHSCLDDPPAYDVSRFHPAAKIILEDLAADELDITEFPFIKQDGGSDVAAAGRAAAVSLRARSTGQATSASGGATTFLYIFGGVTYSEIRSVYELSDTFKRDFYIAGDAVLTPESFMDRLRSL